ncbi:MAG TPA: response regulator transcription factor [Actinomycetota bacterium]|nr:response regulator transcription factor [Actinomycetota bacterium]
MRKTQPAATVLEAVKAAARGESLVDPTQLTRVLQKVAGKRQERAEAKLLLDQLTAREREVLQLLAEGCRSDDIADRLALSVHTVNTHVRNILAKLGVSSKLEAVVYAARHGAVRVGGQSTT